MPHDNVTMTLSTPDGKGGVITTPPFTSDDLKNVADKVRKAPRTKPDPEFDAAADQAYRVTASELRSFIERIERLNAEKQDIADSQKEVFAEAKARGYAVKVMRKIIALRKRDANDVAEEDAVMELYKEALGM